MNELSLYILDIVQNSIKAEAQNIYLTLNEDEKNNLLTIEVIDDGKGMSQEILKKVMSPFYTTRTTRKVGLGLPLFKELCMLCEGDLKIESMENVGTKLFATFKLNHIDLPPLGDIIESLYILITNEQDANIYYKHIVNDKEFSFNTKEIKEALDGISIKEPFVYGWFKDMVKEGLKELN